MVATQLNNQFWQDNHNPNQGKPKDPTWTIFGIFLTILFIGCLISGNDSNHQSPRYDTMPVQDDVMVKFPQHYLYLDTTKNFTNKNSKNQEHGTKSPR